MYKAIYWRFLLIKGSLKPILDVQKAGRVKVQATIRANIFLDYEPEQVP